MPDTNTHHNGRSACETNPGLPHARAHDHLCSNVEVTHGVDPRVRLIRDGAIQKATNLIPAKSLLQRQDQQPLWRHNRFDLVEAEEGLVLALCIICS